MPTTPVPVFSGALLRVASRGDPVRAVQRRLNRLGCGPIDEDGVYGPQTADSVRLFQARAAFRSRPMERWARSPGWRYSARARCRPGARRMRCCARY
jgi:hypothetical protein